MAVETLTYTYTSQAEMNRLFSVEGVDLRTDHGVREAIVQDAIDNATDTINSYLLQQYTAADMADSLWIRRRATLIACYFLSQERGNPEQFSARYERITNPDDGELVRAAEQRNGFRVPRLTPSAQSIPTVTNYKVSDLYQTNKVRVKPENSTGTVYPNQHTDPYPGPE